MLSDLTLAATGLSREHLLAMYRRMVEIREFEGELFRLLTQGKLPGTMHQYDGQEAVAVGVCATLRRHDVITSTHRGHGHAIAKGASLRALMAEMFAKRTGVCRGMGGSMHMADFSIGMLGANGIVGAGLPIALGAALAATLQETDRIAASFFGDGATAGGAFHESLNLAALWRAPVVFVCENNPYGVSTHFSRISPVDTVAERGCAYGVPGVQVDGNDILAVFQSAAAAVERARGGGGPTIVECLTYRHRGHSRFEPAKYRPPDEVAEWLARDPIPAFARRLQQDAIASTDDLQVIHDAVTDAVADAVAFAEESPDVEPDAALGLVYADVEA